jgi:ABC-2 type transport system ATP-binding protein
VEIRGTIRTLSERGTTVLLASHLLGEVEAVCDRVVLVDQGRIARDLGCAISPAHFCDLLLEVSDESELALIASTPGIAACVRIGPRRMRLRVDDPVPVIVRALVHGGIGVESIGPSNERLEDIYLSTVGASDGC